MLCCLGFALFDFLRFGFVELYCVECGAAWCCCLAGWCGVAWRVALCCELGCVWLGNAVVRCILVVRFGAVCRSERCISSRSNLQDYIHLVACLLMPPEPHRGASTAAQPVSQNAFHGRGCVCRLYVPHTFHSSGYSYVEPPCRTHSSLSDQQQYARPYELHDMTRQDTFKMQAMRSNNT